MLGHKNISVCGIIILIYIPCTALHLQGFSGVWFVYLIRYVILFSYIIPIR